MRTLTIVLAALLLLIQWPLWFGKGGWLRVHELQRELDAQRQANLVLAQRNAALMAEVRSFREGREAIEERARTELNMVRDDELFFQLVPASPATRAAVEPAPEAARRTR